MSWLGIRHGPQSGPHCRARTTRGSSYSGLDNCWRRQWHPTPALLPGKSHGRRSLVGCSPTFTFHFHALEKEMTTHSNILAWRIPGTEEPNGLLSMGSHRVRHDWSDLAATAAADNCCQEVVVVSNMSSFLGKGKKSYFYMKKSKFYLFISFLQWKLRVLIPGPPGKS